TGPGPRRADARLWSVACPFPLRRQTGSSSGAVGHPSTCRGRPPSAPGSALVSTWAYLLPAPERPAAAGVGRRAVHGHVVDQLEVQRLLLHHTAQSDPVQRL